ncbi:MAG: MmgE/PrpD family protein [Nitrospinae bacterium]|nr:MmgE/PrpD family protein [Nitrospinota bacterium]
MDQIEARITDYVYELSFTDLTPQAVQATKARLLDSFAASLAAYYSPPVVAIRNFALTSHSEQGSTLLGTSHKSPVYDAALYLGTMIRALDWNDTYLNKEPAHPSDNIPACLNVAEAEGKSGKDLLLAMVIAYELHCRLCDAAGIRQKGWDHVTYGSVSSSAPAAKLMGLSKGQIRDAMSIAITTGIYLRQTRIGTISKWKAAAFAQACQNAVRAALYVKHGMDGPSDIFEGQHGLINQITLGEFDLALKFGGQDGERFKVIDTYIKYFPAEYHSQSAIWAALDLRDQIGTDGVSNIEKIHVETSFHSYEIIGKEPAKWHPETKETADHSLPYIVAVVLMDGEVTPEQFDAAHLKNPQLQDLVQKVTVAEKKEYTDMYGKSFPNKVTVAMKNGKVYEKEVLDPKGHPNNPLTLEELETKFRRAAAPLLQKGQQDKIIDTIGNLEQVQDIGSLMRLFEVR